MPPSPDAQLAQPDNNMQHILDFATKYHHRMWEAMEQKGGWEGWCQVELAFWISGSVGDGAENLHYVAEREQLIFKKAREKIDIWATPVSQPTWQNIGIELKCEGQYQDTSADSFQERIYKDVDKVRAGIKPEYTQPNGAVVYAVGITTNEGDLKGYQRVADLGIQMMYAQTASKMHWVLWCKFDFPKI